MDEQQLRRAIRAEIEAERREKLNRLSLRTNRAAIALGLPLTAMGAVLYVISPATALDNPEISLLLLFSGMAGVLLLFSGTLGLAGYAIRSRLHR